MQNAVVIPFDKTNRLRRAAEFAFQTLVDHRQPGNLTPTEEYAWQLEHRAYELLFAAAQHRYQDEHELQQLLRNEAFVGQ